MTNKDQVLKSTIIRSFDQVDDVALALSENDLSAQKTKAFLP